MLESITVMVENMAAGRRTGGHDTEAAAKNFGTGMGFETSELTPQ